MVKAIIVMLHLSGLSVSVDQKTIIKELSLSIAPGTIHGIMGHNGSGKSSLAHTIMGHGKYQVDQGTMSWFGQDLCELSPFARSKQGIFLAFQQPVAIPGVTVFQCLKEIYAATNRPVLANQELLLYLQQLLAQVGLDQGALYKGLHDNFSGGEKKRLEIVQMLILQPKLIILDEIDSGLDVDGLKIIGKAIQHYLQEHPESSCLIITHYARIFDYLHPNFIHIMQQGSIVRSGDHTLARQIETQGYDLI